MGCTPKTNDLGPRISCFCMGLEVDYGQPAVPPRPVKVDEGTPEIPEALLRIMRKYKFNWRLNALSQPKVRQEKYSEIIKGMIKAQPRSAVVLSQAQVSKRIVDLALPKLRMLYVNNNLFGNLESKMKSKYDKNIKKAWQSMYYYYEKMERMQAKKRKERIMLRRKLSKKFKPKKKQSKKELLEYMVKLAVPKKPRLPEPLPPKKIVDLEAIKDHLARLSQPKEILTPPPRDVPFVVTEAAKHYEITEQIMSLYKKIPPYWLKPTGRLRPFDKVSKAALSYVATPRIEAMAAPKQHVTGKESDMKEDAFVISPLALKYKPTARILELARPKDIK